MNIEQIKEIIRRELPVIMREDVQMREFVLNIAYSNFADKQETESRFDRIMNELRLDREEQRKKWDEQNRKWDKNTEIIKEQNRKWAKQNEVLKEHAEILKEQNRKWDEQNRKWDEQNRKWDKNTEILKEQNRKWDEQNRKWDKNTEILKEQNRKWDEQNRKWDKNTEILKEQSRKWDEQNRKWDKNTEILKEQNRKWDEQNRKWDKNTEILKEQSRKWDEQNRKWDKNTEILKEQNRKWREHNKWLDEQSKRWHENQKDIKKLYEKYDSGIGALGARWGIHSEESFRNGLKGILGDSFGVEVLNVMEFDDTGEVFGVPDQVELDIIIKNSTLILCEIKSSMSRGDVTIFDRKITFYEKRHNRKADRKIIISPMVDQWGRRAAEKLNMEVYSHSSDVRDVA